MRVTLTTNVIKTLLTHVFPTYTFRRSRDSSVSIVSGLHTVTGVRSPSEAKDFPSSLYVQTSSEAHQASYPMGTGSPLPRVKRGQDVTLTTHPHLVPRPRMSRTNASCPQWRLHSGSGTALLYFHLHIQGSLVRCVGTVNIPHSSQNMLCRPMSCGSTRNLIRSTLTVVPLLTVHVVKSGNSYSYIRDAHQGCTLEWWYYRP
jgi:hypothetical protein